MRELFRAASWQAASVFLLPSRRRPVPDTVHTPLGKQHEPLGVPTDVRPPYRRRHPPGSPYQRRDRILSCCRMRVARARRGCTRARNSFASLNSPRNTARRRLRSATAPHSPSTSAASSRTACSRGTAAFSSRTRVISWRSEALSPHAWETASRSGMFSPRMETFTVRTYALSLRVGTFSLRVRVLSRPAVTAPDGPLAVDRGVRSGAVRDARLIVAVASRCAEGSTAMGECFPLGDRLMRGKDASMVTG